MKGGDCSLFASCDTSELFVHRDYQTQEVTTQPKQVKVQDFKTNEGRPEVLTLFGRGAKKDVFAVPF